MDILFDLQAGGMEFRFLNPCTSLAVCNPSPWKVEPGNSGVVGVGDGWGGRVKLVSSSSKGQ